MYIGVKYIGKKPQIKDTVANTGAVWVPQQVLNFTEDIAKKLIKHTDSWELADINPNEQTFFGSKAQLSSPNSQEPVVSYPNFNAMTKEQLIIAAQQEFGRNIDEAGKTKEDVLSEIISLMKIERLNSEKDFVPQATKMTKIFHYVTDEELAALESGKVKLAIVPVPMTSVINSTVEIINAVAEQTTTVQEADTPAINTPEGDETGASSTSGEITQEAVEVQPDMPTLEELVNTLDKKGLLALARQEGVKVANTMNEETLRGKILADKDRILAQTAQA